MIVSKGFWEFVAFDCIDQQLDVSLGTVSHLENWYFSKIEKNSNRYAFNLKLHHLCWVSLAWILFIPGFLPSINITLFLFPVYFEIVKDNRIIFWNNRKTFVWRWFLNLIEFRFLNLIEIKILKNNSRLVVSLASFQTRWWISVGEIWATNQRRPEDSEKYKYRVRFTNHIRTETNKWFIIFSHF